MGERVKTETRRVGKRDRVCKRQRENENIWILWVGGQIQQRQGEILWLLLGKGWHVRRGRLTTLWFIGWHLERYLVLCSTNSTGIHRSSELHQSASLQLRLFGMINKNSFMPCSALQTKELNWSYLHVKFTNQGKGHKICAPSISLILFIPTLRQGFNPRWFYVLKQWSPTTGPRPGTGPWGISYRAAKKE